LETGRAWRNNRRMNKKEIAESLRTEVGHLEMEIKKLQARCERMKRFVLDLEDEVAGPVVEKTAPDSQFRKVIDSVFGEKPK
jgi:predicted RNase H-like nuclease (RuvC/YqgF family)